MVDVVGALVAAFGVVFVAELGDKTQLLALGFGAQHPLRLVAGGLVLGYGIANLLAVIVGGILGAALPDRPVEIVSGLVFFGFAALAMRRALRGDPADAGDTEPITGDDPTPPPATGRASAPRVVGSIGLAIAIAEMGDKTQISTATLASQSAPVGVWIGATLGAAASGMVGAVAGRSVGHRISTHAVDVASAVLFAAFGLAMLAGWF
jgi:putative Ca2+/H+ antiporter (TMEM165/GDT1 family)